MTKLQFDTLASLLKECKKLGIVIDWYNLNNYHNEIEIDYKEDGFAAVTSEQQAKETVHYLRTEIHNHKNKSK